MHSGGNMINIDFLEYLIVYAESENLSKASRTLHISQSALSRAMQKVEDYVGVPIFTRTKNKLSLNETGKELIKNAYLVIEAERLMKERTITFHNKSTNISIGAVAPGPMIKYGNLLYSTFPNKNIVSKIEDKNTLIEKLKNRIYDCIFTDCEVKDDDLISQFAYTENLYITIPKAHFLAGLKRGVTFSEIDGQSFLVSNNLGIWDEIIAKNLPKSKFFPQAMDNLYEIINASTIPNFSTNITIPLRTELERISLPILDRDATVNFYISYKKEDKNKLKKLIKMIER